MVLFCVIGYIGKANVQIHSSLYAVYLTGFAVLPHGKLIVKSGRVLIFAVPYVNVGKFGQVILEVKLTACGIEQRRITVSG